MMIHTYATTPPQRSDIDQLSGPAVLEFGTAWCGHCRSAQPLLADAFATHAAVQHIKVEDGSGRPLGRSFHIKLWPTLIFLRDGKEVSRVVRPADVKEIANALALIDPVS